MDDNTFKGLALALIMMTGIWSSNAASQARSEASQAKSAAQETVRIMREIARRLEPPAS